jgi:hypothetical protein
MARGRHTGGRKPGSKNKATIERELAEGSAISRIEACNRWGKPGDDTLPVQLLKDDLEALRAEMGASLKRKARTLTAARLSWRVGYASMKSQRLCRLAQGEYDPRINIKPFGIVTGARKALLKPMS